jgi:hypothetical protein
MSYSEAKRDGLSCESGRSLAHFEREGQMFAYRVPLNPYEPGGNEWATLVRLDRIRVGDRLNDLSFTERQGQNRTTRGSPDEWEVIAVKPTGDEGRPASLHRILAPEAIWDGALVLRLVK